MESISRIEEMLAGRSVDAHEIFSVAENSLHVEARDGAPDYVREFSSRGWSLRVFKKSRMGFSYTLSGEFGALEKMVERAFFGAEYGEEDPDWVLPSPGGEYPVMELSDKGARCGVEEKVQFATALEKLTRSFDSRIKKVRYATLRESHREVYLKNSEGVEAGYSSSAYVAYVYAVAEDGGQSETGFGMAFARSFEEMRGKMENVARDAASRALRMLGARRIKTGKYPVIIENQALLDVVNVLLPAFSAKHVFLGKSLLAGELGSPVFSELLNLVDDPLNSTGSGARPFDDEGVPSRKTELVKGGVVESYLSDGLYGRKLGIGSTSAARRRGVKFPPEIAPSNVFVLPGDSSVEEMLRELGEGILLTGFLGMHTADPISGDFSVGAQGIYFEGGELKYPVRTFAVSGNVFDLMSRIAFVGRDFEIFGSAGAPSVAFEWIDVGGE